MEQATIVSPVEGGIASPLPRVAQEQALLNIRALPVLLSVLTIALGLIYLAVIPPWAGPDEPRHFEYVTLLNMKGRLVGWGDANAQEMNDIIRSMDAVNYWKWGVSLWKRTAPGELPKDFAAIWGEASAHELHQPPLSYIFYLIPFKLVPDNIRAQLYAMRLLSILLDVAVVLAAYVAGRELFPDDPTIAVAIPVFIMLLPQHLFLHSTVMNDHLVEAALAWLIALIARTFRLGLNIPRVLGMVLALGIGFGAKRNSVYGIGIVVFAFLVYMFVRWGRGRLTTSQKSMRFAGAVIAVSLIAAGLVYAWNWLGVNQHALQTYIVRVFLFLPSEQFPFQLDARIIQPDAFPLYASYLKYTFISLWGHFGWMNISLGVQAYWGFTVLSVIAFIGLAIYLFRDFPKLLDSQRGTLVVFAASVFLALAIILALEVRYWDLGWGGDPQGRYLFPVLIPLATLFLLGLRAFFPRARYMLWFAIVVVTMVVYNIVVLGFFIIPFYRA